MLIITLHWKGRTFHIIFSEHIYPRCHATFCTVFGPACYTNSKKDSVSISLHTSYKRLICYSYPFETECNWVWEFVLEHPTHNVLSDHIFLAISKCRSYFLLSMYSRYFPCRNFMSQILLLFFLHSKLFCGCINTFYFGVVQQKFILLYDVPYQDIISVGNTIHANFEASFFLVPWHKQHYSIKYYV